MCGRWTPTGYFSTPLLVCEVDGFQKAILVILLVCEVDGFQQAIPPIPLLVCEVDGFKKAISLILYWYVRYVDFNRLFL